MHNVGFFQEEPSGEGADLREGEGGLPPGKPPQAEEDLPGHHTGDRSDILQTSTMFQDQSLYVFCRSEDEKVVKEAEVTIYLTFRPSQLITCVCEFCLFHVHFNPYF